MNRLKNIHNQRTCYIIGKGASLDRIASSCILTRIKAEGSCPVIALNETITKIEKLELDNPVYSLQQDGLEQCMRLPKKATLLLSHNRSDRYFTDYPHRFIYDQVKDFHMPDKLFTACTAMEFAKLMGCSEIVFIAFDAVTDSDKGYPTCLGELYRNSMNDGDRFKRFGEQLKLKVGEMGIPASFYSINQEKFFPINIGNFTVMTCTGDRPLAFSLCRRFLMRQTVFPRRWIVVDDGTKPLSWGQYCGAHYIRRIPKASDPSHTLPVNILAGMPYVATDKLVFFEDDDWYRNDFLEKIGEALSSNEIVGQANSIYYRIMRREYRILSNTNHAGLWSTGIGKSMQASLKNACVKRSMHERRPFLVDRVLWRKAQNAKIGFLYRDPYTVGIKEMPGRRGKTMGWGSEEKGFIADERMDFLANIIGDDVNDYVAIAEGRKQLWQTE